MTSHYDFFATAPKYTEGLLLEELRALGANDARETVGGVSFSGDLKLAYQSCLWSRIANRILLNLKNVKISSTEDLYDAIYEINWIDHFDTTKSFAIDFHTMQSVIQHSQYGAQKCKDAIVDQFRQQTGSRPDVDKKHAAIRINVRAKKNSLNISLDLSGHSLHQRGYRQYTVAAPLKENLAAAVLMRANWPAMIADHTPLIDPMCGSGTIVIEAACMAMNIAPGLFRSDFGFNAWQQHNEKLWSELRQQAQAARIGDTSLMPRILGFDSDAAAIEAARKNLALAGIEQFIELKQQAITYLTNQEYGNSGLIVTNAPYGERLSDYEKLTPVYEAFGAQLKKYFPGWQASVVTSDESLAKATGLYAKRKNKIYNGKLLCQIYHFPIKDIAADNETNGTPNKQPPTDADLENRLRKNLKRIQKWAGKQRITCFRVYDADIPEYNFALDLYQSDSLYAVLQEYAAPGNIDPQKVKRRTRIASNTILQVLDILPGQLFCKQRKRQQGANQYDKLANTKHLHVIEEANCKFYVNFQDYLDTGLFLDHRMTRELIQKKARGKSFLNLFSYTGTASVHAALGGATSTTSVDMSSTYLDWSQQNFKLNDIPLTKHHFIKANCMDWIEKEKNCFDLIFVDPPTFSNSKSMDGYFDIQQHYIELLEACIRRLTADGEIIFSTNYKKFKFAADNFPDAQVSDITQHTLPLDFARNRKIHQCWLLKKKI